MTRIIACLTLAIFVASLGFTQVSFADNHLYGQSYDRNSDTGKMVVGLGALVVGAVTFGSGTSVQKQRSVYRVSDQGREVLDPKAEAIYQECLAQRDAELKWSAPKQKVRDCSNLDPHGSS